MSAIGSLVFCTDCGNLLPATKGTERNVLRCECCGAENKDTGSQTIITETKPSDFPSFLRQKLQSSVQAVEKHTIQTNAVAHEKCSVCIHGQVTYTNLQLRGADEGSTVIYICECGNSWHENN